LRGPGGGRAGIRAIRKDRRTLGRRPIDAAGKDDVNPASFKNSTKRPAAADHAAPAHPAAAPRGPEPSGLTLDEIRRIVLDLIG